MDISVLTLIMEAYSKNEDKINLKVFHNHKQGYQSPLSADDSSDGGDEWVYFLHLKLKMVVFLYCIFYTYSAFYVKIVVFLCRITLFCKKVSTFIKKSKRGSKKNIYLCNRFNAS